MDSRHRPTIGLLPLMLELYDRSAPDLKPRQAEFARQIADVLGSDIDVTVHDVCNTRGQVGAAVAKSEAEQCDGIVVLHLSYAPSLISASALTRTDLPLLLLNTTPAARLGHDLVRADIMENHGIHGVQDLANILLRAGKKYHIVAGHMSDPSVPDRAVRWCRAAMAARGWRRMRVGRIGDPFEGMGDFSVDLTTLQSVVGPQVFLVSPDEVAELAQAIPADQVLAEVAEDRERFAPSPDFDPDLHALSVRAGLGLAAAVEQYELDAVSMHFMAFNNTPAIGAVPFLGVSKLQAQGIGYAGEGDVTCAALVAAMSRCFGEAGFTEMFCPDWEGNQVLMAHMGECNPNLAAEKPILRVAPFPYGDLSEPVVAVGGMAPGPATLVNLVCIGGDRFRLTSAEIEVTDFPVLDITMPHFKIQPAAPLGEFLACYSEAGGSHHLAIVPGHVAEDVATIAALACLDFVTI